jgi:hypothetical protein
VQDAVVDDAGGAHPLGDGTDVALHLAMCTVRDDVGRRGTGA